MVDRRKQINLQSILMLLLSVVIAYAVWQNQMMYEDIKTDVKDIKVAISGHLKEQVICEKKVESKIACLETVVYGRAYANDNNEKSKR